MDSENFTMAFGLGAIPTGFIMINSEHSFFTGVIIYVVISFVIYGIFESRKK